VLKDPGINGTMDGLIRDGMRNLGAEVDCYSCWAVRRSSGVRMGLRVCNCICLHISRLMEELYELGQFVTSMGMRLKPVNLFQRSGL
jgi:hypothetical protein